MVPVKEIVERDLYSVEPGHSVADVLRRMSELKIGAIVVLEGGRLQGVFSERDLMTRVVIPKLDPDTTLVSEVMTTDVATVDESAWVEVAMESMRANQCRHLPVLRGEEVIGFLSMRDLMHFELARKTEELHRMRAYIHGIV
jgi:CBS domain-containing protein